jgi:ABC-type multidrug transport system ATPase subunit
MILDEPIASLDPEGERAVFELFAQQAQARIIVFTTHRYDSIPRNTDIVVLVDGHITETGTHDELLQRQRDYWSLYMSGSSTTRDQPRSVVERPPKPPSRYWMITRLSELDRHDLDVIDGIRKSGVKVNSFSTDNIAVKLVRE